MVGEDSIVMRGSELRRVHVIRQVVEQQLTQRQASEALGVTTRQIRRLSHRLQAEGDSGLAHRSRGQPSNRRKPAAFKQQVLQLYTRHYGDCGPTLAVEQLATQHGLRLSDEMLRRWLRAQGGIISGGARGPIARGGLATRTAANWCSWMAPIMIGSRGAARAVC